jgi:hypothetical protein
METDQPWAAKQGDQRIPRQYAEIGIELRQLRETEGKIAYKDEPQCNAENAKRAKVQL